LKLFTIKRGDDEVISVSIFNATFITLL
jgi:hypothetical protein